jgi:hypothetical protein
MSDTTKSPPLAPPPEQDVPPLAWWRRLLVLGIFVVLLGALVVGVVRLRGGTGGESTVLPTTVAPVPTTVVTGEQPPPLYNVASGDNIDWDRMVRANQDYEKWLYDHRRPDLLSNLAREDNPSYQNTLLGLTNLAAHPDWHYDPQPPPIEVRSVRLQSRPSPDKAVVIVQLGPISVNRVVDGTGKVVFEDGPYPPRIVQQTLQQDQGTNRWRLARTDVQ